VTIQLGLPVSPVVAALQQYGVGPYVLDMGWESGLLSSGISLSNAC